MVENYAIAAASTDAIPTQGRSALPCATIEQPFKITQINGGQKTKFSHRAVELVVDSRFRLIGCATTWVAHDTLLFFGPDVSGNVSRMHKAASSSVGSLSGADNSRQVVERFGSSPAPPKT
jgi:hypothetical protein